MNVETAVGRENTERSVRWRRAVALPLKCATALTFGMALTMAFAPSDAWWFAPYCVAGLLLLLTGGTRSSIVIGGCFGLGWFGAGFWWILPALDSFSDAGLLFSFQLTAALVVYMSLFPACAAVAIGHCLRQARPDARSRAWTALRIAMVFSLAEWARSTLFGGFPMLATGYAHTAGPLSGFAPLIGVQGLGFLNTFIAASLAAACLQPRGQRRVKAWCETAALIALLTGSGALLQRIDWSVDTGRTLSFSLLQGNLSQAEKYSDAGFMRAVGIYRYLAASAQGQLTVLPETALPAEWSLMPPEVAQGFQDIADARHSTIVIGSVVYREGGEGARGELMNSAIALRPHGAAANAGPYRYDKQHLVPFAESLPYGTAWIGERLGMQANGLTPGRPGQAPLVVEGARVALTICFEDLFDTAVASQAADAEVIVNLTNFAWFAGSFAPVQHLQVAQMRALENARWFIQVSNTGTTALIDAHGRVQQRLPENEVGVLEGVAELRSGRTPFMVLGNWPLLLAAAATLAWSTWRARMRRNAGASYAPRRSW